MKRPTQVDVANRAGVSRATVSYVINGLADGKVPISQETRERVLEAVEDLGYEPDAGARALRSGATKTIGLIIHDLHNPHFWEHADGVEQEARASGYRLLLSSTDLNAEYGEDAFKDLSGRRIDALILMGSIVDQSPEAQKTLARSLRRRLPIVEISDHLPVDHTLDTVFSDYRSVATEAMNHLLSLGHRRIGFIYGVSTAVLGVDRLQAYQDSFMAAGLPLDQDLIVHCGPTIEDGYRAALRLLEPGDRPTAIVTINDLLAIGVLRGAGDLGLRAPADFSLVGFDDISAAKYLVPRLTTASKDAVGLGRAAARLALGRLQDPGRPRQIIHMPSRFVIRESTGPAPAPTAGPA